MIPLDHSYATDLDDEFSIPWSGAEVPDPRIRFLNRALVDELGLDAATLDSPEGAAFLAGMRTPDGARPVAQAYAGHQFGGFSPRLGDGRALLLGELRDPQGRLWDLHLKGSGATPFSRGGDGKAVLGPVLREVIVGEAMHALGIPTTRALAALTTGEMILRQDGPKPGAILARIASSHLRVGTFQYFAARQDVDRLRRLLTWALERHDPELVEAEDPALALLRAVRLRQTRLVAQWMGVGFIHGVMNTDNTSISGETIDYGPCAFMEATDPNTVYSSIDRHGRYAYGRQPEILQWNLARLAEALLPVIDAESIDAAIERATEEVNAFGPDYREEWTDVMRSKLGLVESREEDTGLAADFVALMTRDAVDFTTGFRRLATAVVEPSEVLLSLFPSRDALNGWLARWRARLGSEGREPDAVADAMDRVNPIYIARNHRVEEALDAAETELDLGPTERLLEVLADPFTERPGLDRYAEPAPGDFGPYVTYCGT